jgi:hypothetical protein
VTGEEERQGLVPQLLVRHPRPALLVLGEHEHREQVSAVNPAAPPLFDDAVDDGVEPCARAVEAARLRQR